MGPRKIIRPLAMLLCCLAGLALTPTPSPLPETKALKLPREELSPWTLVKQKAYPNYKVEILQRTTLAKFPRIDSTKVRIIPQGGGSVTEYQGTWINPDPRSFVADWKGGALDLDGDGLEDLVLQNYSAGVHCCYNYVLYSLATPLRKIGNLEMKDCGAKIRFEDLNGDKKLEILSCNSDFTYLGKLSFAESPFPPAVYSLQAGQYRRADKEFKQVFVADIQRQKEALAKGYSPTAVLQIVADYFLLADEAQAWKEFDSLYQGEDKENLKLQLLQKLGKPGGGAALVPVASPSASPAPLKGP